MHLINSWLIAMTISFTPMPIFADTALGFKKAENSEAPQFIKEAAKSTFEILIPFEDTPNEVRIFDLDSPKFAKFREKIDSMSFEDLTPHERIVIEKQIERCRRDKIDKTCPLYLSFERGTAFLAGGDGSFVLTNAHVVHHFMHLQALTIGKSILTLLESPHWVPAFLFDESGALVIDPFLTPPGIVKHGQISPLALLDGSGWYAADSDYVVIKTPSPIGKPLKIGKPANHGETLFRLGFASCTGCPSNPNKTDPELNVDRGESGNSDGHSLYWTSGPSYSLDAAAEFLGASKTFFENAHKNNWVFFEADAQVGMSGGPILNTQGEVVGVFAGSKPKKTTDGKLRVMSRGVRPPEFNR